MSRSGDDCVLAQLRPDADGGIGLARVASVPAADLAGLCEAQKLQDAPLNEVLPAGQVKLQLLEAPPVEAQEMREAVRWKIKDLLDYDVEQAVVDVFSLPAEDGRPKEVYAVYAHEDQVRQCVDLAESAGLNLRSIDISELAQRNIAARLPEDETGVALLSLQEAGGLLTLTRQGCLYLARDLDTGYRQLAQAATAPPAGEGGLSLGGMPEETLESLVLEIQRSLDYYESHFRRPPIKHLVIAPMPVPLPQLTEQIEQTLGLKARLLDLGEVIALPAEVDAARQAEGFFAIGAALREDGE